MVRSLPPTKPLFLNLSLVTRSISGASFKPYLMSQRSSITLCKEQGDNSYASRNKSSILIYGGEGSSEDSRKLCYDALLKVVDSRYHAIEYISPEEIKEGTWTKNCCLIAFGGGYDLGFINALGQKGTHIIRDFVQQGGSYLGFCAGAYWACNYIEFDKGGSLEVVGERFLKFFPGNCIGPAYPGFDYKNKKGVHAVPVSYKGVLFRSYLHGGGIFTQPRKSLENKESTSDSSQKAGNPQTQRHILAGCTRFFFF
ncbi:hypothetical protein RRG08_054192 [Elysia crispata]|uniref:Biotin-protein ligase N-terminal domain-containing protein n=1 Tax=Elysia crispata TaxID=231223 RepID=A0AAE1DR86_9GAST|nr:hypothetical protein RRG08_054192 [Elysia crispata]